ncbi:MAG: lactonase family protein [Lachnospiraceae bacterium]|nr:lactonase family protein [Lachnospiraceae bacterium]
MAGKKDGKFVAYVSCYTRGSKVGIRVYDVDVEKGVFHEKEGVEISNSSYVTISHNRKYLYSITDYGVEGYRIRPDGGLENMTAASINGMRGCYLSTDYEDRFLFVAGYHDGKITVLSLNTDGTIGGITDEVYHRGIGSIADRNFRPHVNCVKMTRDNKYLLAADLGLDHVKVYQVDHKNGKLKMVDIIHSEQYSGPRHIKISKDGRFIYIVHEAKNYVDVYRYYEEEEGNPEFEKLQTISTLNEYHAGDSAASALNLSRDFKYIVCSNAGDNSVIIYKADQKSGMLEKILCLPISGAYPKDAQLFPDNKHLVSLNHEDNTMTFFAVDLEKGTLVMNTKEIEIQEPNCIVFHKVMAAK